MARLAISAAVFAFAGTTPLLVQDEPGLPAQTVLVAEKYQGLGVREWAYRAVRNRRALIEKNHQVERFRRALLSARSAVPPWPWGAIAGCESGSRWAYDGHSGFDGALQFHPRTWSAHRLSGYPAFAWQATPFQQVVVGEIVLASSGWGAWPDCSSRLGLRQ